MAAVPETKASWTDGADALSSTNMNAYLRDPLQFLMRRPRAQMRQVVGQTIATATSTALTMTVEDLDDDVTATGGHDNSTDTTRYTALYPGWYQVSGGVSYAANATGRRGARWAVNGAVVAGGDVMVPATAASAISVPARTMLVELDVGDYVELHAWQESGGNLSTAVLTTQQSTMTVVWDGLIIA